MRFVRTRASEFGIDPRQVGAVGVSSGATLASLATLSDTAGNLHDPDPVNQADATVQAFVGVSMPADLTQPIENPAGAVLLTSYLGRTVFPGSQQQSPELAALRSSSPVQHVTRAAPPMLLIHGDQDALVPASHASAMRNALQASGVPQKLVIIPGGNHGRLLVPGAPDYRVEMVEWLRLHVGPQQQAQ